MIRMLYCPSYVCFVNLYALNVVSAAAALVSESYGNKTSHGLTSDM